MGRVAGGRCSSVRTLLRGTAGLLQIERRIDEPDVREALRKVADEAAEPRVVFLGHQPEVVAQMQNTLEKLGRVG